MNYKDPNKQQEPSIRTVEYSQHVQKWWWSFSLGQRVILANMAGFKVGGKIVVSYDQISHNFSAAYVAYEKLA
jgi:hypothetical protein